MVGDNVESTVILHTPYNEPMSHYLLDENGRNTGKIQDGRRPSQAMTGIPGEEALSHNVDVEPHITINQIREHVRQWRDEGWPNTTSETRRLLEFWAGDSGTVMRPFWCQIEAAETAIYLYEAGQQHDPDFHQSIMDSIDRANSKYNDGIPRTAFKMATGTGKTNLIAMISLWITLNRRGGGEILRHNL